MNGVKIRGLKKQLPFGGILVMVIGLAACIGCGSDGYFPSSTSADSLDLPAHEPTAPRGCELPVGRSTVMVEGMAVDLLMPADRYVGDLLVLPPWNGGREEWCIHARFCTKALKRGFRLIMPDMGKSIYAQAVYPETRADWQSQKTITWVKERLVPDLRNNYCLLKKGGQNYVLGASAGARGAILLAEEMPDLFVAVAALSGDYNPAEMTQDNIYRGFLGEFDAFPQRWQTAENVLIGSTQIRAAVYLGHGKADDVVSYRQTVALHDLLRRQQPQLSLQLHLAADQGNDFSYWASEIGDVLDFFEGTQAGNPEGAVQ